MAIYVGISISPQGFFWRDNLGAPHILTWYQSRRFKPPWPSTSLFRFIEPPALRGSVSVSHIGANTVYKWLYMLEYHLSPQCLFWRDNHEAPHILTQHKKERNYEPKQKVCKLWVFSRKKSWGFSEKTKLQYFSE